MYKVIHRDNFGRDYDTEVEVTGVPSMTEEKARKLAGLLNSLFGGHSALRYYDVVPADYKCQVFEGY